MTREEAIYKLNVLIRCAVDRAMIDEICREVIGFLESQMPRVMTWREIVHSIEIEAPAIWLDDRDKIHVIPALTIISCVTNSENATFVVRGKRIDVKHSDYGKRWRAWTARPTEEQRKTVKWDD